MRCGLRIRLLTAVYDLEISEGLWIINRANTFSVSTIFGSCPAKVAPARSLWIPAVNNHGGLGHWANFEMADPCYAEKLIRGALIGLFAENPT